MGTKAGVQHIVPNVGLFSLILLQFFLPVIVSKAQENFIKAQNVKNYYTGGTIVPIRITVFLRRRGSNFVVFAHNFNK